MLPVFARLLNNKLPNTPETISVEPSFNFWKTRQPRRLYNLMRVRRTSCFTFGYRTTCLQQAPNCNSFRIFLTDCRPGPAALPLLRSIIGLRKSTRKALAWLLPLILNG